MYADLHALIKTFDERTMPPLTRFLDTYIYSSKQRAMCFSGAVVVAAIALVVIVTAANGKFTLGALLFAIDLIAILVLIGCLPSRIVRAKLAERLGACCGGAASRKVAPAPPRGPEAYAK